MRYKLKCLLMLVLLVTLSAQTALPALAQAPTGSIRGVVTDEKGDVIQNATVTITNKTTGETRTVSTGSDGIYSAPNLQAGEYEVRIEAQGFATSLLTLVVQTGSTTTGDRSLRVGAANEIVDVVAEAPIIDKENYKIDGVINRQKIDSLPLNGRNFLQLALLEPGVGVSVSNPGNANNLFNVSIGGAGAANTRITVDGGSVLDFVTGGAAQNFSTETIQEFQISTFNFDLSTGVTGVGAVNIVSRTGGNDFRGSAFFFARDDQWAAVPSLQQGAPDFRRYQYGGSIGGPIVKDRALFFGNVEWLDQDAVFASVITGHPALTRLSSITASPYDGIVANLRFDFPRVFGDKHNLFARYSHDNNDTFAPVTANTLPSNWRVNANDTWNIQTGLTSLFTGSLVNDFRFNYQRIENISALPTEADCPLSNPGCIGIGFAQVRVLGSNLQLGNSTDAPQDRFLDRYQLRDDVTWNKGSHRVRIGGEWEHNYGKGQWEFLKPALLVLHDPAVVQQVNGIVNTLLPAPVRPLYTIPLPAAFTTPNASLTLNDILQLPLAVAFVGLGNPEQPPPFNQETARQSNRYRWYAQDSWQMFEGFTLSYGVSYLYETNLFNHDLAKPRLIQPLIGTLEPSQKDKNNFAPALGFAWDVKRDGKTVIRGGAGMFYDTSLFVTRLRERSAIGPLGDGRVQLTGAFFRNTIAFPQIPGIPAPLSLINPGVNVPLDFQIIPTKFTGQNFLDLLAAQSPALQQALAELGAAGISSLDFFKTGTDILDPGNVTPYSLQYSLGVAHQLPGNMAINVDFVLRRRLHNLFQNDFNLFNQAASFGGPVIRPCTAAEVIDPTAQCSNGPISVIQSGGRDEYRAMLVKLDKRFSNRFQFTASYALSDFKGFLTGENLHNWFEHYVNLGADVRHRFTFSGVLDLPWSFQVALISVLQSRPPFNARVPSNIDLNGDGTTGDTLPGLKPNSLNRGVSKEDLFRLVNDFNDKFAGRPDARGTIIPQLILPPNFEFGDNFQSHDIRITKIFRIGERYQVQGLMEIFNVFNNANLGGHSGNLDVAVNGGPPATFRFGQPTARAGQSFGTGGPRAVQLGARFTF